eukprot:gene22439-29550_t
MLCPSQRLTVNSSRRSSAVLASGHAKRTISGKQSHAVQRQSLAQRRSLSPLIATSPARGRSVSSNAASDDTTSSGETTSLEPARSSLVQAETVYFIFQLDLDSQLQQYLNKEAYDMAQEVRLTRERVDAAVEKMKERKLQNSGSPVVSSDLSPMDFASEGLRLRSEMQRAVEQERYADAAQYRDQINALEQRSKTAAALAAEFTSSEEPKLRLGHRVTHAKDGYRGVVIGWDSCCCEVEEWMTNNEVEKLSSGKDQYFYHVLVDKRDWQLDLDQPPVAYVAQEMLTAPDLVDESKCWKLEYGDEALEHPYSYLLLLMLFSPIVQEYGDKPLEHPYSYMLFLGQDAKGDYLPCRQLRNKYSVQRRDVHPPSKDGEDGADEEES